MTSSPVLNEERREYYFRRCYPTRLMAILFNGGEPGNGEKHRCCMLQMSAHVPMDKDSDPLKKHWTVLYKPLDKGESTAVESLHGLAHLQSTHSGLLGTHVSSLLTRVIHIPHSLTTVVFEASEFVMDMDLKDWGMHRSLLCDCNEKSVCSKCWVIAEMVTQVCQQLISQACALGPVMVVYSGGKGFHLWWGSPTARQLTMEERQTIIHKVLVCQSQHGGNQRLLKSQREVVRDLCRVWVQRAITKRALLANTSSRLALHLKSLAPPHFNWPLVIPPELNARAQSHANWKAFAKAVGEDTSQRFIMEMGWPRVDEGVTLGKNHNIKTPFAIHASTGRVALPLESVNECEPELMPTMIDIVNIHLSAAVDTRTLYQVKKWQQSIACLEAWLSQCHYI
jgi:DNA primase catalytic subunit